MNESSKPSLLLSFLPLVVLITLLSVNVVFFFDNTLSGPNQLALLIAAFVAVIISLHYKKNKKFIFNTIVKRVQSSLVAVFILLIIGALAGTWLISGIIPLIIYYGIGIIHPKIFLFTTVIVCSLVSLATGSSWSTVATVGLALNGIGLIIGIHPGLVAGAIISGAYFGDKMSPLSDTTNLASAMTETDIFTHIRYMMYTTVPAMLITLAIFLFVGLSYDFQSMKSKTQLLQNVIENNFNLTPVLLIVPVVLILLIVSKVKPLPSLIVATILAGIFAILFQADLLNHLPGKSVKLVLKSMLVKTEIETGNNIVSNLLRSNGMLGMLRTVLLIISAMIFSGAMEAGGMLEKIAKSIIKLAKSTGSLVATTVATSVFFNLTASDQYIAIVVPGRMFSDLYKKKNLKSEVLSRTLEDAGTQTSVLVPWNTCGATQSSVLGVSVFTFAPYCFFNLLSPVFSIAWAYLGFKIRKIELKTDNKN